MNKNILTISLCSIFIFSNNIQASNFDPNTRVVIVSSEKELPQKFILTPRGTHIKIAQHSHNYGEPCYKDCCGPEPLQQTLQQYRDNSRFLTSTNPITNLLPKIIKKIQKRNF